MNFYNLSAVTFAAIALLLIIFNLTTIDSFIDLIIISFIFILFGNIHDLQRKLKEYQKIEEQAKKLKADQINIIEKGVKEEWKKKF